MRARAGFVLVLSAAVAIGACSDRTGPPTAPLLGGGGADDPRVAAFVELVNAHRQSLGIGALVWDSTAAAVALAHSRDMATRGYFSHTNPEGESPADRLRAAGIRFTVASENIAFGFLTADAVFVAWMNSPDHRANIEYAGFTHHGVGRYGTYWTHVFFTPRGS
jgi:uncharacterized protein YkwD